MTHPPVLDTGSLNAVGIQEIAGQACNDDGGLTRPAAAAFLQILFCFFKRQELHEVIIKN